MATIVTRSGKGSALTHEEVDANFTNLNTDKIETNAEVRAAVEAASDSNVFTDADHTKLNAIEASADVTDTVNVVAALTAGSNITIAADGTIAGAAQYTHPTHDGDDAAIDTGALSGATVISDLDLNITTDTLGHVTDANATVSTRDLTLADLGYTGDADTLDGLSEATFMRRSANSGLDMNDNNITDVEDIYLQDKIYHDGDTDTYIQFHEADQWRVVTGGTERLEVNNTNITMAAHLQMSGHQLNMNNNDIIGVDQIFHHGDTNTYIQFHASDQFRVVTGGSERLEVNNSRTQIDTLLVTGTATFSGTVVGAGGSTSAGAVGTYVFVRRRDSHMGNSIGSSGLVYGSTYAGSDLRPSGISVSTSVNTDANYAADTGSNLSGTYRAMGYAYNNTSGQYAMTLMVRIS